MFKIETERLIITVFSPDMAHAVHKNSLDEVNCCFLPDEVFKTVEDAAETIEFLIPRFCHYSKHIYASQPELIAVISSALKQ